MGSWKARQGLALETTAESFPKWSGQIQVAPAKVEFKLVVLGAGERWEHGGNKVVQLGYIEEPSIESI